MEVYILSKTIKTRIQNKHDTAENWLKATFTSLPGEFYIYDDYDPPKLKIGDGVHAVKDLPFSDEPIENSLKITGTVTKALGGIAKDKTYTNANIAEVLSDLLFPYVAPTFSSISTSATSGTFEYGTTRTVTKVTPNFTKSGSEHTNAFLKPLPCASVTIA